MISVPVSCITAYIMIHISEPISVPCTTCTNVGKSARVRRVALRQDKDHLRWPCMELGVVDPRDEELRTRAYVSERL